MVGQDDLRGSKAAPQVILPKNSIKFLKSAVGLRRYERS